MMKSQRSDKERYKLIGDGKTMNINQISKQNNSRKHQV